MTAEPQARHAEPSYVVVVITPAGQVMISRPSLMTADEAEHEAGIWRTTDPDSSGRPWRAIVRDVNERAES